MLMYWMAHTGPDGDIVGFYESLLQANEATKHIPGIQLQELQGVCPRLQVEVAQAKHNLMLAMQLGAQHARLALGADDEDDS
jgi:hypothetical protein